jgi:hypothetical protein
VVTGDAALTDPYAGMTPADLVLACGVFGNMTDEDVERTVGYCTQLCARGGPVVWTRGRWEPDRLPQVCDWFAARGFEELWVSDPAEGWGVGAHRFAAPPAPPERGARMFTFTGYHPPYRPRPAQVLKIFFSERSWLRAPVTPNPSPGRETHRPRRMPASDKPGTSTRLICINGAARRSGLAGRMRGVVPGGLSSRISRGGRDAIRALRPQRRRGRDRRAVRVSAAALR